MVSTNAMFQKYSVYKQRRSENTELNLESGGYYANTILIMLLVRAVFITIC